MSSNNIPPNTTDREKNETSEKLDVEPANTLTEIPKDNHVSEQNSQPESDNSEFLGNQWCEICYQEIEDIEETIRCNSCNNDFHTKCVAMALETSGKCPLCKSDLLISQKAEDSDDHVSAILRSGLEDDWPTTIVEKSAIKLEHEPLIFPTIWMLRGSEETTLSEAYQPLDLITIIIQHTGRAKQTYVKMIDSRDQARYHAKSGGSIHKFITRLQNTKTFGQWRFSIETALANSEENVVIEVPFELSETVTEDNLMPFTLLEGQSGYVLQFYEQEEEMFKLVESEVVEELEITEEITEEFEIPISSEEEISIPVEAVIDSGFPYMNKDVPLLEIGVSEIHGIGPSYKKKLNAEEINFVHDLVNYEPADLSELIGVSANKCRNWIAEARDIVDNEHNETYLKFKQEIVKTKQKEEAVKIAAEPVKVIDESLVELKIPVNEIKGIGPSYQKKLVNANIQFVHELLPFTADELSEKTGVTVTKCANWLVQAREMMSPDNETHSKYIEEVTKVEAAEEEVVEKISESIDLVNKDLPKLKIPITEISGIGPSYAKKFESHKIFFVHHILPYTAEALSDETGMSIGRCEKWVAQAQEIANDPENEIYKNHS